ncbi:MHS family MFS transporter [Amycolatopsis acidicola]|uniref:Putative proline/betaine transporter n=1 Tax=Amycolatopsis acidicola TaxID=2596893 RepID=A0A5N0VJY3_9PSEU|nr:MFS transporter [Amycolatopsis acidicola]KAA9166476.1 MHS family MFS transporter [Amycolatopsis acidicola]
MNAPSRGQEVRTVTASMIGTAVEFYDFSIYGVAASLVFSHLFFPAVSDVVGTLLSLSTFAIAFVARPIGAAVFGHFGDRVGRKGTLFVTLMLMGIATVAIGLLPTYGQIGVLAPILLVFLRLVQGFSLGGEQSGAMLMSVESARDSRRGMFGAFVNSGAGWGLLLANLVYLLVARLSPAAFQSWGWRVPFVLSAVLVVVGLFIRLRLAESPEFQEVKQVGEVRRLPLVEVLRDNGKQVALLAFGLMASGVSYYIAIVYSLSYGAKALHKSNGTMLSLVLWMTGLMITLVPLIGWLSDRWGMASRRLIFVGSSVALMATSFLWFTLLNTGDYGLMLLGFVILFVAYCANIAVTPTFFALAFPARVRYSGMALGFTLGTVIGASIAPLIATALQDATGSWVGVAVYMSGSAFLAAIAGLLLREYDPLRPRRRRAKDKDAEVVSA